MSPKNRKSTKPKNTNIHPNMYNKAISQQTLIIVVHGLSIVGTSFISPITLFLNVSGLFFT